MSLTSDHWWCVDIVGGPHDGLHLHLAHLYDTLRLPRTPPLSSLEDAIRTVDTVLAAAPTDGPLVDVYRHHRRADGHHVYLHPHVRTYPEGDA